MGYETILFLHQPRHSFQKEFFFFLTKEHWAIIMFHPFLSSTKAFYKVTTGQLVPICMLRLWTSKIVVWLPHG